MMFLAARDLWSCCASIALLLCAFASLKYSSPLASLASALPVQSSGSLQKKKKIAFPGERNKGKLGIALSTW